MLGLTAFLVGVFLGTFWPWPVLVTPVAVGTVLFSFFVKPWRIAICVIGMAFLCGVGRIAIESRTPAVDDVGVFAVADEGKQIVEVRGALRTFPDRRFDVDKWVLSAQEILLPDGTHQPVGGKVLFQLQKGEELEFGEVLSIKGVLKIPFESAEFSYRDYLAREHIYAVMNYPQVVRSGTVEPQLVLSQLYNLRQWFDRSLRRALPDPEAAFAAGILIGDRSGFSPAYEAAFRASGLSHLLALSGANITIIALAVFWLFRWFPKTVRLLMTFVFLIFFVVFVGGGASILRAAIMGIVGLFVVHSGRIAHGITLLLIASAIMTVYAPLILVFDASFQLSFAGVCGLLGFAAPLQRLLSRWLHNRFWTELLSATLAAQLGVMPAILFLFGEISLVAPLANIIIPPFVPAAMLISFVAVIPGSALGLVGSICAFFAWNLLHVLLLVIKLFAKIPWASVPLKLGFSSAAIFALVLVALVMVIRMKQTSWLEYAHRVSNEG